jgi:hypothetical protein
VWREESDRYFNDKYVHDIFQTNLAAAPSPPPSPPPPLPSLTPLVPGVTMCCGGGTNCEVEEPECQDGVFDFGGVSTTCSNFKQYECFFDDVYSNVLIHTPRYVKGSPGYVGLRGWEFCPFSPIFATFSTFTKIPQVPSFQAHSPVKTVFRQNAKNARKSQNTPSTNPYQNETKFPLSSLKNATSGHARPPKSVLCPPVISGTNSRQNYLKFP